MAELALRPHCLAGACQAKPSSTSCTTRGSWGRTPTRTEPRYVQCGSAVTPWGQSGSGAGSNTSSFLSVQNGTCRFQPEKAIAFVKDVINITQVRPRGQSFHTAGVLMPCQVREGAPEHGVQPHPCTDRGIGGVLQWTRGHGALLSTGVHLQAGRGSGFLFLCL